MSEHTQEAYQRLRERNNAAARRSRQAAKYSRAQPQWLDTPTAGLTARERTQAKRFLADMPAKLTPNAKAALRKHLEARRQVERERVNALIAKLDA